MVGAAIYAAGALPWLTPQPLPSLAAEFGGDISSAAILDFVDSGKNLLLAASSDASDAVRSLVLECGVELDDKATTVYDHFSHQAAGGAADPTLIATAALVDSKAIFGSSPPKVCVSLPLCVLAVHVHSSVQQANSWVFYGVHLFMAQPANTAAAWRGH